MENKRSTMKACPLCRRIIIGIYHNGNPNKCNICENITSDIVTGLMFNKVEQCHYICSECINKIRTPNQLQYDTMNN